MSQSGKIRVLVVDDSAIVRKVLSEAINAESDMEVVGTAPDPFVARDKILALHPDVLTLDIEMPRMDGLSFLKRLMHFKPMPVIVISSLAQSSCETAVEALRIGAVEVLAKPGGPYSVGELRVSLPVKVRAAARARIRASLPAAPDTPRPPSYAAEARAESPPLPLARGTIIALGASTGGTEALFQILAALPPWMPGMVITQHIPKAFSVRLAERLHRASALTVKEAETGDEVVPGMAFLAPGDQHLIVKRIDGHYRIQLSSGPRVCYQRPSVDVMFASVAAAAGKLAIGGLLTGMGSDGAQGLLTMRKAGAITMVQDEATSVVFGMPKEALRLGAAEGGVPLPAFAGALTEAALAKAAGGTAFAA